MGEHLHRGGWADHLGDDERRALGRIGTRRALERGAALFVQGEPAGQVALVLAGHAKVVHVDENGAQTLLAVRGPGELVGELAALDGGARSATVLAMDGLRVLVIEASRFRAWLRDHPDRMLDLLDTVIHRLRESDESRADFAISDVGARLCRRLLELASSHGVPEGDGVRIELPVTQEELAGWVGASRESVARHLQRLRHAHAVSTARRRITLLDVDRVRHGAR